MAMPEFRPTLLTPAVEQAAILMLFKSVFGVLCACAQSAEFILRGAGGRAGPRRAPLLLFFLTFCAGCCYFGRLLVAAFCVLICLASFLALLSRSLSLGPCLSGWLAAVALACDGGPSQPASQRSKGSALRKSCHTLSVGSAYRRRLLLRRRFRSLHSRWRMFITPGNMTCLKVGSMTRNVRASQ